MELQSVTSGTFGFINLRIFQMVCILGTKNAADLDMCILSRYLNDTSIIYN